MVPPDFSVILPAYNPGEMLRRSVSSVIAQTHQDFELLVIDDGGDDDLSWVTTLDPRIRLIRQANRGVSAARNAAAAEATGEMLAFLDQDDEWLPGKLQRQAELCGERPTAAFYYSGFDWVRGPNATPSDPQVLTYQGLLANQHACLSSVAVRRSAYWLVGGHDPIRVQMQDYDLFLRLAMLLGNPHGCPNERLVRYHLHDANASADYLTAYQERRELLTIHLRRAEQRDDAAVATACRAGLRRTRELYGAQAFEQARQEVRQRPTAGATHLGRAVRWAPGYTSRSLVAFARRRVSARKQPRA